MKVIMPSGARHGWGVCGDHLRAELAKLEPLPDDIVLCATTPSFEPMERLPAHRISIGYCFFESRQIQESVDNARRHFNWLATGSHWCHRVLMARGWPHSSTIIQGIDHSLFHPDPAQTRADKNFVVFSGGKFEYRKGQDIVIAAMRDVMRRHKDIWLAYNWYNPWPESRDTMARSSLIDYDPEKSFPQLLHSNDVCACRTIQMRPCDNVGMVDQYHSTDIGVFPNRVEGGTNLVLMEYMACGKPAIAAYGTGQMDVLPPNNDLTIHPQYSSEHPDGEVRVLDVVNKIEMAYEEFKTKPEKFINRGYHSHKRMKAYTWETTAKQFHVLAEMLSKGVAIV